MKKFNRIDFMALVWLILGILYIPFYIAAFLIHVLAKMLLSLSYFGLLDGRMGKDVFKSIFYVTK